MSLLWRKIFLLVIVICAAASLVAAGTNPPGRLFLAANAVEDGVVSLPSGLQYKVLESGSGTEHPFEDSPCLIHYEGRLLNDLVFDSSYNRGKPVTFAPKQLILGWTEALQLMVVGDKVSNGASILFDSKNTQQIVRIIVLRVSDEQNRTIFLRNISHNPIPTFRICRLDRYSGSYTFPVNWPMVMLDPRQIFVVGMS